MCPDGYTYEVHPRIAECVSFLYAQAQGSLTNGCRPRNLPSKQILTILPVCSERPLRHTCPSTANRH